MNHGGAAPRRRRGADRRDPALDGIRGLAAFAVVLSHVAAITWVPHVDPWPAPHVWTPLLWHLGAPAVDMFFVLSGYVVARSIMRNRSGYMPYLLGRFTRLLPVAWAGVLAGLLLRSQLTVFPEGVTNFLGHMLEPLDRRDMIGLMTMFLPVANADRVDGQLWTMFVETQASAMLPLAVLIARRSMASYAAVALLAGVAAILATGSLYPLYFTGLALGAGLAVAKERLPVPPRPSLVLAAGMAILLARHWTGSDDQVYRVVGAAGGVLVLVAVLNGAGRRLLEGPACQWLGSISYPLYAVHVPIMVATCILLADRIGLTAATIAGIAPSLAAAQALRILVDRPATRLSRLVRS